MPETKNLPVVTYYTPVELIGIYRSYIERGKNNNVVWLRGIYVEKPNQNMGWTTAYDELCDVNCNYSVTLKINGKDRERLKSNSLLPESIPGHYRVCSLERHIENHYHGEICCSMHTRNATDFR